MTGFLAITPIDLDLTLGCGQAHRWHKKEGVWKGVLGDRCATLAQGEGGVYYEGISAARLAAYLRIDDDMNSIYRALSERDPLLQSLTERYRGLRLLRQDPWECLATYILAVNARVERIANMVEAVCSHFGRPLNECYSFPSPQSIASSPEKLEDCRLGYRCARLRSLAEAVADGSINLESLRRLDYKECTETLKTIEGVGDKVADCVALFSMDHSEAFPVDARIKRCLMEYYGVTGSYHRLSSFGRDRFGDNAGYAQEFLYKMMGDQRSPGHSLGQTHEGGR